MKRIKLLTGIAALGFTINLQAQLGFEPGAFQSVESVNVQLTALVQDDIQDISNGISTGLQKFKINNKTILAMTGAPNNLHLVLLGGEQLGVQQGDNDPEPLGLGAELSDIGSTVLVSGKATETTDAFKQDLTETYLAQFSLGNPLPIAINAGDLQEIDLFLIGKADEKLKTTEKTGSFKESHSFNLSGAGEGTIVTSEDEVGAVITGKISTNGSFEE